MRFSSRSTPNKSQAKVRKAAAVVELAICLPVIVFIILAGIDVTTLVRNRQAIVEVTHETARVIATNEVNEDQCRQFAIDLLDQKNFSVPTIDFDPAPSTDLPRGTPVTVAISVPVDANCTLISHLFPSLTLDARATVSREIGDLQHEED